MELKNRLFPYPILSPFNNDYIDSIFNTNFDYEIHDENVFFSYEVDINNDEICRFVEENIAALGFLVECPITSYRELIKASSLKGDFLINSDKISNFLTISVFIVSNEDIDNYHNKMFNSIYSDISFKIQKYGLLGIGDTFKIPIKKDFDEIKSVSSIFSIIPNYDTDIKIVTRDLFSSGKKIIVKLPKEQFDNYKVISKDQRNNPIIHSMIIIPILVEIFTLLKSTKEWDDYEINGWFFSLEKAFEKKNLTFNSELLETNDPYFLAQIILDMPISNGLDMLLNISIISEDVDYES